MHTKLTRMQWDSVVKKTKIVWERTSLGKEPTMRSVGRLTPGGITLNPIRIVALLLLLFVIGFTGQKAMLHAIPVADSMYTGLVEKMGTGEGFTITRSLFTKTMQILFVILSEMGIIYFMLLAKEVGKVANLWRGGVLRTILAALDVTNLLPYLPKLVAFLGIGYVFLISNAGDTISLFDKFLPVLMGIALTFFVEDLVDDWNEHRAKVEENLKPAMEAWQLKRDRMWKDEQFLSILHDNISEALMLVETVHPVTKKKVRLNVDLLKDTDKLEDAILEEYERNTGNLVFARKIAQVDAEQQQARADLGEHNETGRRIPPDGAKEWTKESLWSDLLSLNASKNIRRADIRKWYAPGYKADAVWYEIQKKWNK